MAGVRPSVADCIWITGNTVVSDMLIDLHAHSSGIGKCCGIPFEEVLKRALAVGIDGGGIDQSLSEILSFG